MLSLTLEENALFYEDFKRQSFGFEVLFSIDQLIFKTFL
jgi:hypothetical protein